MHSRKNRILSSALYCSIVIFLNLAINIVCVSFIYATNNQRLVYLKDVFSSHRTGFGIFICGFVILVAILSFCLLFKNPHRFTNSINTSKTHLQLLHNKGFSYFHNQLTCIILKSRRICSRLCHRWHRQQIYCCFFQLVI